MKKAILFFAILLVTINVGAQKASMFRKVPLDLFANERTVDKAINGEFLWRLGVQVTGMEYIWNKADKKFDASFLSSAGPAISYSHFYQQPDGTPATNWGVNAAVLLGPDLNNIDPLSFKVAMSVNLFNLSAGPVYTVNGPNHFGFILNGIFKF